MSDSNMPNLIQKKYPMIRFDVTSQTQGFDFLAAACKSLEQKRKTNQ